MKVKDDALLNVLSWKVCVCLFVSLFVCLLVICAYDCLSPFSHTNAYTHTIMHIPTHTLIHIQRKTGTGRRKQDDRQTGGQESA